MKSEATQILEMVSMSVLESLFDFYGAALIAHKQGKVSASGVHINNKYVENRYAVYDITVCFTPFGITVAGITIKLTEHTITVSIPGKGSQTLKFCGNPSIDRQTCEASSDWTLSTILGYQ